MFVSADQDCPKSNVRHLQLSAQEHITNRQLFNSLLNNQKQPPSEKSQIIPETFANIIKELILLSEL